jgi:hypothetical protein
MKISKTIKYLASHALLLGGASSFAHDGHGLAGTHWHATDVWGFAALVMAVIAAIYLSRGGK